MLVGHLRRPRPRRHGAAGPGWCARVWTLPTNLLGHLAGSIASGGRLPRRVGGPAAVGWLYPIRSGLGLDWVGAVTLGHAILHRPGVRRRADDGRAPHAGARAGPHAPARPARPAVSAAAHPGAGCERSSHARQSDHGQPRARSESARADLHRDPSSASTRHARRTTTSRTCWPTSASRSSHLADRGTPQRILAVDWCSAFVRGSDIARRFRSGR